MARIIRDRITRKLEAAEGYLMIDLPHQALDLLQSRADWASMQFEASFLTGEALRALGRFREAIVPLEHATTLKPGHVGVAIALGWCYKRTHRLAQAIDALEGAARKHPGEAIVHYNLACYWSLVGNAPRALDELELALALEPELRKRIASDDDFAALRGNPDFARIVGRREMSTEP
jgi:tetratricopeptide (TPR) repeat protein